MKDHGRGPEHIQNHVLDKHRARDFTSATPGTRLCGYITYLRTGSGWLYAATDIEQHDFVRLLGLVQ